MPRPYANITVEELEGFFKNGAANLNTLKALRGELVYRSTARANLLAGRVNRRLSELGEATKMAPDDELIAPESSAQERLDPKSPQARAAKHKILELRQKLLDLSNRNRLINFKHSAKGGRQIRIVDESLPDVFSAFAEEKSIELVALPPLPDAPDDETDAEFVGAYEEALLIDKFYLKAIEAIESEAADDSEVKTEKAKRALKDRLRKKLGRLPRAQALELSVQAHAARFGINASYNLGDARLGARRRRATHWQTLLTEDELSRRLKAIEQQARESREEYGIETLYIVMGYLEWYESTPVGEGETMLLSPLVLQPLAVEKKQVQRQGRTPRNQLMLVDSDTAVSRNRRETYILSPGSDEISINLCLRERLRDEKGLILPEWDEDSTIVKYLAQVTAAISEMPNWKVRPFATISHLTFNRLAMWLDLDCSAESTAPPQLVPVIGELFGGRDTSRDSESTDQEVKDVEHGVPALVMDCDSSQFAAIRSALHGDNMVIQGPPGTGKSQTISNLIAAALWEGKSVLFVAEKMAALDVVHKRLNDVGLGDFLLELHSAKSGKKPVLESIRKRLQLGRTRTHTFSDSSIGKKRRLLRDQLNEYARAINSPFGVSGWSNHDILWMKFSYHGKKLPAALGAFNFSDVNAWDQDSITERQAALVEWTEVKTRHDSDAGASGHPWEWVKATNLFVPDCDRLLSQTRIVSSALSNVSSWACAHDLVCGEPSLDELTEIQSAIAALGQRPEEGKPGLWRFASTVDCLTKAGIVVAAIERHANANQFINDQAPGYFRTENAKEQLGALSTEFPILYAPTESITPEGLLLRLKETEGQLKDLEGAATLLGRISSAIGINTPAMGSEQIFAIVTWLVFAAKAPSEVVSKKHALGADGATTRLREWCSKVEKLRTRISTFSHRLAVPLETVSLEAVEAAIVELSKGGLLAWFRSGYRQACATAKKLIPSIVHSERQAFLEVLAVLLRDRAALISDPVIKRESGELFVGVDTYLPTLKQICVWVDEVKQGTPIIEPHSAAIRAALFPLSSDLNELAKSLEQQQRSASLRQLADRCRRHDLDLGHIGEKLQAEYRVLRASAEQVAALEWKGDLSAAWIARLQQEVTALEEAAGVFDQYSEIGQLLMPDVKLSMNSVSDIRRALERVKGLPIPKAWRDRLCDDPSASSWEDISTKGRALSDQLASISRSIATLAQLSGAHPETVTSWKGESIEATCSVFDCSIAEDTKLTTRARYLATKAQLLRLGLAEFEQLAGEAYGDFDDIADLFRFIMLRSMCYQAFVDYPCLAEYRQSSPDAVREKFRNLDSRLKEDDRTALINRLLERPVPAGIGTGLVSQRTEAELLNYVTSLERPRTSVRELIRRSGRALQALKPCFMMSPLSVAQLINRGQMVFDVVIFDEASQVKPEDALPALSRGRQFVVVGDKMQLPPTVFGDKSGPDDFQDDEESGQFEESAAVESILESVEASGPVSSTLLWHYRSRDPSLIAFSNREFYQNRLQLFPAPRKTHPASGVKYVWVQGTYASRTNLDEARCCARAAVDFMRSYPDRSLGIVALNRPQADLIELELDKLIHEDDEAQDYRGKWAESLEPLFVKNLENVQGDERDVIFVSTVFGLDEGGNFFQRFGPINSKVGHRRLNVLFTRAKHQLVLFTSIPLDKIKVSETANWGVRALKQYLEFARSGRLETGQVSGRSADSPFEVSVRNELEAAGYQCEPQVGVSGFFIDLAVRHPQYPDHFMLGIECDGATYHRTASARDRDRLRQEILEGLGWEIFRIWSTDWFSDPTRQLGKLLLQLDRLKSQPLRWARGGHIDFPAQFGKRNGDSNSGTETAEESTEATALPPRERAPSGKWHELKASPEFGLIVQQELTKHKEHPALQALLIEAFDLNLSGVKEITIEVTLSGPLERFRAIEAYNRAVYQWIDDYDWHHLGSMPWIENLTVEANITLRAQAVVDVVQRYRK